MAGPEGWQERDAAQICAVWEGAESLLKPGTTHVADGRGKWLGDATPQSSLNREGSGSTKGPEGLA